MNTQRTNEEIARALTQYLMGGSYYAEITTDETKALILAALNEATAERDREIARLRTLATREGVLDALTELDQLRADKERLDWLDNYMTEYLMVELFGMDVDLTKRLREVIDARRTP